MFSRTFKMANETCSLCLGTRTLQVESACHCLMGGPKDYVDVIYEHPYLLLHALRG